MATTIQNNFRVRRNFGKINKIAEIPNLIAIQKHSYDKFLQADIPPEKRDGYTIEIMINEVIAEGRLPTTARIMRGVTHRTKRQKLGRLEGYRRTWEMFWTLLSLPLGGVVRWRTYWFYLRGLTVES